MTVTIKNTLVMFVSSVGAEIYLTSLPIQIIALSVQIIQLFSERQWSLFSNFHIQQVPHFFHFLYPPTLQILAENLINF